MKRELGDSGLSVVPLSFGGNVFGWTVDKAQSFRLLDAFVDSGCDLLDTANMYSTWVPGHQGGESESIIGEWLKQSGKRDKIVLATKVGLEMGDGSKGLKKDYILRSVEDSLRRLQTDCIDLYQSHWDDETTSLEETLSAYQTLIEQGKVRAIGASNYSAARLEEAHAIALSAKLPHYVSLQPEYNLYDREAYETELLPTIEKLGLGVISYYSLASGFLSGKYRSEADFGKSARGASMSKYLNDKGYRVLAALDEVAANHQTVPAVIALAWLQHQPSVTAPIASATSVEQWEDLAKSLHIQLSTEELERLGSSSR